MLLQSAVLFPLLVALIGAAPQPSSFVLQGTDPGFPFDSDNLTFSPPLFELDDSRAFTICGRPIDAPRYTHWSKGATKYHPYVDYSYKFQDQLAPRTWTWQLWAGGTGRDNRAYDAEHIYELQLVHWFFQKYLVNRDEVKSASGKEDEGERRTWLCRYQITPNIVNSKDWTIPRSFDGFDTPAEMLSAQLSGDHRPSELVYLISDLNSLKRVFFALYIPRPHNHLEYMLEDLAKVSLLALYLNQEIIFQNFGRVSRRMHSFYASDLQTAVEKGRWTFARRLPWGAVYEDFERRWVIAIERNLRSYRDSNLALAQAAIKRRESDTGSSMQWLRDQIREYQRPGGRLSDEVFSLGRLRDARKHG